jgi:acetoacetate decarboxylase
VIPVSLRGREGGYTHCMFLNDQGPIAAGRELWGFPKKLANPTLHDTVVGTLDYGPLGAARGTVTAPSAGQVGAGSGCARNRRCPAG